MPYDYFYNGEAEQYIHYTLPKPFFKRINDKETNGYENEELTGLSLNAKFLYSILLDKAKLSDKNGFTDEDGKVCVYYPQAKMAKLLHVERKQLYKYLNELDIKNGIGLIERRQKLGKGRTDCIYVKNFAKPIRDGEVPTQTSNTKYKYFCDDDSVSAARFNYYPLPKALFYDVDYAEKHNYPDEVLELQKMPSNAKMAYTYFLDLLPLSISKGKKDEYGRYFVICPEKDLQKLLGCCLQTVRQTLNQLDIKGGVGLIERSTDNPAIIYILDYSARLSFSSKPKDEKNTHQNKKSTHQDEESTHQQSEKSTHQNEKSTHQKEKSTHPIYNNPYFSNPYSIDTHSINQSSASENANSNSERLIDGLIDRTQNTGNEMSFPEMLKAINFPPIYFPVDFSNKTKTETDFYNYYGRDYNGFKCELKYCTIPYWLKQKPKELKKVLQFIFGYNCYKPDDREIQALINSIIESLLYMLKSDIYILNRKTKQAIKYHQIIDIINELMHNSMLIYWLEDFTTYWGRALSDYRPDKPEAYFRSCIWKSMNDFQSRKQFYGYNDHWQANYDYNKEHSACSKSSDYESDSKYSLFCNSYEPINDNKCEPCENHMQFDEIDEIPNEIMVSMFLVYALKNNKSLKYYLNKDYPYPLPDGLTLDSPFDLTDEKLKELETKYGVSLISLRVQENKNCNDSNSCDLETLNENPLHPESIEPIEESPEPRPEAAGTEIIPEAENFQYSDSFLVSILLGAAVENNKPLKCYLKDGDNYPYPLPDGLTPDSPFDLTDEKLKELEAKYGVSLISLRVQENEKCNDSNNYDLEAFNENPLQPESIEPIEQSSEHRPEAAITETISEADNLTIISALLFAIKSNKSLKDYLKKDYPYHLPDGLTLDSPFDLTDENLKELEVKYNVSLRVQENENNNDSPNDLTEEKLKELEEIYGVRLRK